MATGEQQQQSQEGKAASIKNCDDTKLSAFNDLLHKPYFSDCFYYLFWVAFWFVTPAFALTGLIGMAIYDIFHIKGFRKPEDEAAILITGCDSGFGQACAKDLAALGWKVYAGCLTKEGIASYDGEANIKALKMDVTKPEEVKAVMVHIAKEERKGLYCLVNNAGVGVGYATDWSDHETTMKHYRWHMDINFFSVISVTKLALPLLKKAASKGLSPRIVTVSSISALIPGQPLSTGYNCSKHAIETWSSGLRVELKPFGIDMITLCPTWHRTPIAKKTTEEQLREFFDSMPTKKQEEYGWEYFQSITDSAAANRENFMWKAKNFTEAMIHAITSINYKHQYVVGLDGRYLLMPYVMMSTRVKNWTKLPFESFKPAATLNEGKTLVTDVDDYLEEEVGGMSAVDLSSSQ